MLPKVSPHKLGEDVEFFAVDSGSGEPLPAWKWFPQQKEALKVISSSTIPGERGNFSGYPVKVFRDGLAVELNVAPTSCRAWLWQDVLVGLKHTKPIDVPNFTYSTKPYIEFSDEFKKDFPEDLQVLGCNPTLDAYTERTKRIHVDPKKINFRTSGSHFHMSFCNPADGDYSWGSERVELPQECWSPIIKLGDLLMAVPATYIFGDELEFKRRKLYGQAGEFRFQQAYGGIEYRALSSRIFNHPALLSLFSGIWKYVIGPNYPTLWEQWDKAWEDDLQLAINEGKGLEEMLKVWDKVMQGFHYKYSYTLGGPDFLPESFPIWKTLRDKNLNGAFPDGGIFKQAFPEGHTGWDEWSGQWGLHSHDYDEYGFEVAEEEDFEQV